MAHTRAQAAARISRLEALLEARGDGPQLGVYLAWRAAQDEVTHGVTCYFDVVEGAQQVDLGLCEHDARARGVFNCEFGFAVLASNAADGSAQMVAVQRLHVFNLKSLEEEVVEAQQRDGCGTVSECACVRAWACVRSHRLTRQIRAKTP